MIQAQSYQGYFKNGQFMSPHAVKLPENMEVFITITGRAISEEDIWAGDDYQSKLTQEQQAAIKFINETEKINKEGFDTETLEAFEAWDNGEFQLDFEERLS